MSRSLGLTTEIYALLDTAIPVSNRTTSKPSHRTVWLSPDTPPNSTYSTKIKIDADTYANDDHGGVSAALSLVPSINMNTDTTIEEHLSWTSKQGRILTGNGRATELYCAERGFPFVECDLPHYRLLKHDTSFSDLSLSPFSPICGAWWRSYFVGGWECSTWREETVFNVQTNSLFVDLRIPTTRNVVLTSTATCLEDYTNKQLRYFARQHVFGGLSIVSKEKGRDVCVRHHVLDWNFVGTPRPRPNKWWIEPCDKSVKKWKEWAYATDEYGQHYYCEQWERLPGGEANDTVLALRKERQSQNDDEDGILVVVGNHFNYIRGHALVSPNKYKDATSLVELVDAALEANDRETAITWLGRIRAGHGLVASSPSDETSRWMIDCAIEPWKEGTPLLSQQDEVFVEGDEVGDCSIMWNSERWDVFDTNMQDIQQVKDLFESGKVTPRSEL